VKEKSSTESLLFGFLPARRERERDTWRLFTFHERGKKFSSTRQSDTRSLTAALFFFKAKKNPKAKKVLLGLTLGNLRACCAP
jgi:hypothetical protein